MSLLAAEDFPLETGRQLDDYVWREFKIRVLVPKDLPGKPVTLDALVEELLPEAIVLNCNSASFLGAPGVCQNCGLVTIQTESYPWGKEKLKMDEYCPHCDGGEDVG